MMKKPSFMKFLRAGRASTCLLQALHRGAENQCPARGRASGFQNIARATSAPCGITAAEACSPSRRVGGEIAELLQVGLLLLVARRQLEQARGGAAEDVVLGLLRQERQVVDGRRQVEVPVRIVRRV